ncbi:MAG: glycosyltransferase [Muribaculaceae bacterium]|nr:glycosyltransferase [Muribaculaceae bacterium]
MDKEREEIEITVCIPVYNAEKWIGACIDSILSQDTDAAFEVICVDDASSDNSASVVEEYAKRDKRVRLVKHVENRGPMVARRTAIESGRGKYYFFCDADDFLPNSAFRALLAEAHRTSADIIAGDLVMVNNDGPGARRNRNFSIGMTTSSYLKAILKDTTCSLCGALIARTMFENRNYETFENQIYNEDRMILTQMLTNVRGKVAPVDAVAYCYRVNPDSTTRKPRTEGQLAEELAALVWCYDYAEHYHEFARENDGFMMRKLGLMIEEGNNKEYILGFDGRFRDLMSWGRMKPILGARLATHISLCRVSEPYRKFTNSVRHALRRRQHKE